MDSPQPSTKPLAPGLKRRTTLWVALALTGALILTLVVFFALNPPPDEKFVWLTPAQFAQSGNHGPLTQLKYKVLRMLGPLARHFSSPKPTIIISSSVMTFSPAAAAQAGLGAPFATNTDGMSAWIIPPAQLASFRQGLNTNSGVSRVSSPTIQTTSGMQATIVTGQSVPLTPGVYTNVGIGFDILATAYEGSVKLLLGASSTELQPGATNGFAIKTNFFVACRVTTPDAGGLLINCRNGDAANPTNYWLLVAPTLVNAAGNPVKR